MAYGKSHTIEYKDYTDVDTRIELWENGYVGAVTECEADEDPLTVDVAPMDPTIFIPVIGQGATLRLNSATSGQFLGLYTTDPVKRMIKIFKNNNAYPWWLGYINPEQYGEGYSRLLDYPVTINCNDGLNALNRFKYIDETGAKYTSLETFWNIFTRILSKMGLPFRYVYFASKYTTTGVFISASETILHNLKADQLNYYDEKDEPMTYRQVLEAILSPFGLQIRWHCGSILVFEPQMMADANFSAKRFNSSFVYVDTLNISLNFDISNGEINWDNEDQALDVKSGYSRQRIRYSPYVQSGAIKKVDVANRYLWSGTEDWTEDMYGVWRMSGITAIAGLTLYSFYVGMSGHKDAEDSDKEDIYVQSGPLAAGLIISTPGDYRAAAKSGQLMQITGDLYIKTKNNEFDSTPPVGIIRKIIVPCTIEVDGKGPYVDTYGVWRWGTEYTLWTSAFIFAESDEPTLCDKWLTFKMWVPPSMPGGTVVLKIWAPQLYFGINDSVETFTFPRIMRYKNIDAKIYNATAQYMAQYLTRVTNVKEITNDDAEYKGELNAVFMNEAPEITLLHADALNMTDRGAIRKLDGTFTAEWKKSGVINYRLADLLIRSITSQYQESMTLLLGTMEADMLMGDHDGPSLLHTIQDVDYLGAIKLIFTGGQYNDYRRTLNGSWLEVRVDDIPINIV